ncbi:carboxymuconolactone decarboxylase family protein [Amycolatopsis anabasis]|uniref:carboxymuconolactone decarboxylase family protein n=1 Tax=Amycolatopsis anabasis TaxID=1840409 RepID=UPI00131B0E69|nr:carboxymuconolactone decarboxylase family protein [Amycolatopsis anabasis]
MANEALGAGLSRAVLRRAPNRINHVTPIPRRAAGGLVATVYAQVEREFGLLAPPIMLHSPAPAALAAVWVLLRETLLADGVVDRATKEAVATSVSLANDCPYCVEVHATALDGMGHASAEDTIAHRQLDSISDPSIRTVAAWARESGTPDHTVTPAVTPAQLSELLGVATTFHYLNRMVNVFLEDSPLPPAAPSPVRVLARRVLGLSLRPTRPIPPGAAARLLPAAMLPNDLRWARASAPVGTAMARAAHAIDQAATSSVPESVRDLVTRTVAEWDGTPAGPSRRWARTAVRPLPPGDRAIGELALLTALASHQTSTADITAVREHGADDRALVELTSWASMLAARQIAERSSHPSTKAAGT